MYEMEMAVSRGLKIYIWITCGLSVLFAILFFPFAVRNMGFVGGWLTTLVGLVVIWAAALLRAYLLGLFATRHKGQQNLSKNG